MELAQTGKIRRVTAAFAVAGEFKSVRAFGNGHIHDTYLLETGEEGGNTHVYILQCFNHQVFTQPELVMQNIQNVTAYLQNKGATTQQLITTKSGSTHYIDEAGNYWRVLTFIGDTYTAEEVQTSQQACEAAHCFGQFARNLMNLEVSQIHETIPRFHDLEDRYAQFEQALTKASPEREQKAVKAIEQIQYREKLRKEVAEALPQLPRRIVHNDTKINNVLLDNTTHKGVCAIDLDTIMPGYALYDFGDMVRTFVSPVAEDSRDLEAVIVRKEIFKALTQGYLQALRDILVPAEKQSLWLGAQLMPYMMATRFLTDYLLGDVYYKTAYAEHNLDRCLNQLALLKSIEENKEALRGIIEDTCRK